MIISKEEAMALPAKDRPICFRISSEMYSAAWEFVGITTRCYNPQPPDKSFLSDQASDVVIKLCFKIAEEVEKQKLNEWKRGMTDAANLVVKEREWSWAPASARDLMACHNEIVKQRDHEIIT